MEKLPTESLRADDRCDWILVIDDFDCHDPKVRRELFDRSIMNVDKATSIDRYVGFASPEIEAWIVADWDISMARDPDFRGCHNQMRHWLSSQKDVSFDQPETFSCLDEDRGSCVDKLSDALVESSVQCGARSPYSKGVHTARFLQMISTDIVHSKCPLFRELRNRLTGKE